MASPTVVPKWLKSHLVRSSCSQSVLVRVTSLFDRVVEANGTWSSVRYGGATYSETQVVPPLVVACAAKVLTYWDGDEIKAGHTVTGVVTRTYLVMASFIAPDEFKGFCHI